jgi:hypothetical protein
MNTTITYVNHSNADTVGGETSFVAPVLGVIVGSATILNIIAIVFLLKDKASRKHSQWVVFLTILVNEIFINCLYIFLVFWRGVTEYVCLAVTTIFTVGLHNIFNHLIYICVERFCALKISRKKIFSIMTKMKVRMAFLVCSIAFSFTLFMPPYFVYGQAKTRSCGIDKTFYPNVRIMVSYARTISCIEIFVMCFMYLLIAKEIQTLINVAENPSSQQHEATGTSARHSSKKASCPVHTFTTDQGTSSKAIDREENLIAGTSNQSTSTRTACPVETITTLQGTSKHVDSEENVEAGSSNQGAPSTNATKNLSVVREERVQMQHNVPRVHAGLAWKLRAYKMVKYTILTTIIPSIPMVATQIVGYIRPDLLNETTDTIISVCTVVHTIMFPVMFLVSVKK